MASTSHQTSLDMSAFSSFIRTISQRNYGLGCCCTPSNCLPVFIRMQQSPQATADSSQKLGKIILSLSFQAVLALFISSPPTSPPPLLIHFFAAAVFISFAVSFAALFLHNSFPRTAHLFEKVGALFSAFGVCFIASFLLVHQNFAWICWVACTFSIIVFALSFK